MASISCIFHGLGRPSDAKRAERTKRRKALDKMFTSVRDHSSVFIEPADYPRFKIKIEDLAINDTETRAERKQDRYFQPFPLPRLKRHPIDWCSDRTQKELDMLYEAVDVGGVDTWRTKHDLFILEANLLSQRVGWQFDQAPRAAKDPKHEGKNLREMTKWKLTAFRDEIFERDVYDRIFHERNPWWSPKAGWKLDRNEGKPHVMFTMKHGLEGNEKLLRGEVLALIGAMKSRLGFASLHKHVVVPVMIISITAQHGRILQAYFNGDELIIRKSQLYDFDSEGAAQFEQFEQYELFARYMASDACGDTKSFSPKRKGTGGD